MKNIIILFSILVCLLSCSQEPYRIVQMENDQYVIQNRISFIEWRTYCDAEKCFRFNTKLEASKAFVELMNDYNEGQRANTLKTVIK